MQFCVHFLVIIILADVIAGTPFEALIIFLYNLRPVKNTFIRKQYAPLLNKMKIYDDPESVNILYIHEGLFHFPWRIYPVCSDNWYIFFEHIPTRPQNYKSVDN